MNLYVISLTTELKRRTNTQKCFDAESIPFRFFDAIKPEQALDQFFGIDGKKIRSNAGRDMTRAEMACYASHRALWQLCVDHGKSIIIMEDDVEPTKEWKEGIFALQSKLPDCGYVRLDPARKRKQKLVHTHNGYRFIRLLRCPFGAHAYAITPNTAAQFLSCSTVIEAPVDVFIKQFWRHGVPLYRQDPSMVKHRQDALISTITGREKSRRCTLQYLNRQLLKVVWAWNRGWFNIRHR